LAQWTMRITGISIIMHSGCVTQNPKPGIRDPVPTSVGAVIQCRCTRFHGARS
jgi:hypothetical protein